MNVNFTKEYKFSWENIKALFKKIVSLRIVAVNLPNLIKFEFGYFEVRRV